MRPEMVERSPGRNERNWLMDRVSPGYKILYFSDGRPPKLACRHCDYQEMYVFRGYTHRMKCRLKAWADLCS